MYKPVEISENLFYVGVNDRTKNLFENFPVEKLKMSKEQCTEIYSDGNKRDLAE